MPHYIDDHGNPGIQAERMYRTNPPLGQHITNLDKALDNVTPADMYLGRSQRILDLVPSCRANGRVHHIAS
jgi:hypothetical protein